MQKLVPYWGISPEPGSTYYLQKLSYDLFGIVDHRDESSAVTTSLTKEWAPKQQTIPSPISSITSNQQVKYLHGLLDFMCSLIMQALLIRINI